MDEKLQRAAILLGEDKMRRLSELRVIVFGVGGVGSWCAEALVRSGVRHIAIVDSDVVCPSNINRQLMATTLTIGQPKVEAMRQHLLTVAPEAEVTALQQVYCQDTADGFHLEEYDCVVDAIDSLADKALLMLNATAAKAKLYSSMGAALKTDPTQVAVAEFWKVQGCPLARALRNRFKRMGQRPSRHITCVYSPQPCVAEGGTSTTMQEPGGKGSLVHITAIFGMTLAGLVINNV